MAAPVTPQTPTTPVIVHVADPNQQALILQQQQQLAALQAQMAEQQRVRDKAGQSYRENAIFFLSSYHIVI